MTRAGLAVAVIVAFLVTPFRAVAADDQEGRFAEARTHLLKGRVEEALEVYAELDKAGADSARVAIARSQCLVSRGDWREATDVLIAAVGKLPANARLLARTAELQFSQGRFQEAAAAVEEALKLDANLPLARIVQADLQYATGKLDAADEGYRWFVRWYNQIQQTDPEALTPEAMMLVARGASQYARWNGVPKIFNFVVNTLCPDALQKDKDFWPAYYVSGALLLEKFNRAQALPDLRKGLAINPRAAEIHTALAEAALEEHALDDAEQHCTRALEANPRQIPALCVQADLRLEAGNLTDCLAILNGALAVNPHDERVLARVAACYVLQDGAPPETELAALLNNLERIETVDGTPLSRFGERVVAVARINPHPGIFLTELGEQLESRRKFDLAERCYRQAIVAMPRLASPRTALGMLCMRVGKLEEAGKILDEAFKADPYHVKVSNMRKVARLLDTYDTIQTDHFVIRIDSQADRILGRYMAEYLEEIYPALVEQFKYEPQSRTQFEIFNRARGLTAHQWFSARMVGLPWVQTIGASTGMIVALASPTASEKPFNWARVLKHEFVHILTLQGTAFNIPHWYTEALAVMSEGYPRSETWNQLLVERVPSGELFNLDTINQGFARPKAALDWQMAYCQSLLYAQYMLEAFGPDANARLLDAYRRNESTDRAIPDLFKLSKSEFETGYREFLQKQVAELKTGSRGEPPLTPAEAEKAHRANPGDGPAAARYAYTLLQFNRRKEARALAEEVLQKNRAEPLAAVVLARLEVAGEDIPAAIDWLEPALDRDLPHPKVLELLAGLRLKQEEYIRAARLYEMGLAHDPEHVPWLKGLATALIKGNRTARLRAVLEKLVVADADDALYRRELARLALAEQNFADVVKYARLALHVDVLDVETHRLLAQGYLGLAQPGKAVDEWSVAVQLKSDDPDLTVELCRALADAGRKDEAISLLKGLLKSSPEHAPANELLGKLE